MSARITRRGLLRSAAGSDVAFSVLGLAACQQAPAPVPTATQPPVKPTIAAATAPAGEIVVKAYPELSDAGLNVGPKAMDLGYPGNRTFFRKDADARQLVVPALEKVFITGSTPVAYFREVAQQVTAKMRA